MDRHPVDHDLGEERGVRGKELQEQRAYQRLPEQAAEAHDRGDEPGEVERPAGVDQPFAGERRGAPGA